MTAALAAAIAGRDEWEHSCGWATVQPAAGDAPGAWQAFEDATYEHVATCYQTPVHAALGAS